MTKDRPNSIIKWFTAQIVERWVLRHFSSIKFIGELEVKQDRSCLMLMNHYRYNDGVLLYRLCRTILKKEFKTMVIESQIKTVAFFRYVGGFSISKKSRSMIDSLNYAAELVHDPKVMLGIYPQAGLYSMYLNRIHFANGLEYIFKRTHTVPFQIFFGVTLLDYLENFKPVARVYLTEYQGERQINQIEEAYNQFYYQCKQKQQRLYNPPERVIDPTD